jgi:hypothetical protein
MGARDFVENHPLPVYVGVFLAAVGATLGVVIPVKDAERDSAVAEKSAQVADLQRTLATIPRANGAPSLDVSKMVVTPDQATKLPASWKYFPGGGFYAQPAGGGWHQSQTTELQLLADQIGQPADAAVAAYAAAVFGSQSARAIGEARRLLTAVPVELWRRDDHRYTLAGVPGIQDVYPEILVQRFPISSLAKATAAGVAQATTTERTRDLKLLERLYRGDAVGVLLTEQLNLELSLGRELDDSLDTIQKEGNVVYAHFTSTLTNGVVNGKKTPIFIWPRELIVISTQSQIYLVKTFLPRTDFRSSVDDPWVSRWLASFKIVAPPA